MHLSAFLRASGRRVLPLSAAARRRFPSSSAPARAMHLVSKEVAAAAAARPARPSSGAAAARLLSGEVLMFGGYTEDEAMQREATNEAYAFDPAGSQSWRHVECSGTRPRARLVAQAVAVRDKVWLIGGWDPGHKKDGGVILDDLWCYHVDSGRWEEASPQGQTLPPASRHQACAVGDNIFIHTHRSVDGILVLDTASHPVTLSTLPVLPDAAHGAPSSRGLHSMTAVQGKLYIFGGAPQRGPMLDDLWVLDTEQRPLRWRRIEAQAPWPRARCSQAAAAVGSKIVMVGGSYYREDGGLQPLDDAWVFDTEGQRWEEVAVAGCRPSARNAAVLVAGKDGTLVYHGGWRAFQETYNDTFVMHLA